MKRDHEPVFLDTSYINALVNTRDEWHDAAVQWEQNLAANHRRLVTTEFVLLEIADGLAAVQFRAQAARVIKVLQTSELAEIVPSSSSLFVAAFELYQSRADQDWGLTDCASFVIMHQYMLSEALTTDRHFQQAGFRALLLEDSRAGEVQK